jgi:translocation and assembly module TamB
MTWPRRIAWFAIGLATFLLLLAFTTVMLLRSDWFYNQVRLKLISTIENATGGRVEIGSFRFDWRHLRAEVTDLVIHGTEPADKPPLFRAPRVALGLKLLSISRRDVDIQYLDVTEPHIFLMIARDGTTNVPQPKVKSKKSTIDTILDAAIGRFNVDRGIFEVNAETRTPFTLRGENLSVRLGYDLRGPKYTGLLAISPLRVRYDDYGPLPFQVDMAFGIERNRIAIQAGRIETGPNQVSFSGTIDNFAAPRARLQYVARASLADVSRIFRVPELRQGSATVTGLADWTPSAGVSLNGTLQANGVEYRDSTVHLAGFRATGAVSAGPRGVEARGLTIAGDWLLDRRRERVEGRIGEVDVRRKDVDARGIALNVLNASFRGSASVRGLDRYNVEGEISGLDTRRAVALYTPATLPWDALVSGRVRLEGSLLRRQDLRATVHFMVAPAPSSAPVTGQINAVYEARGGGMLDLGRSTISLPNTRADFSGSLGHQLNVHVETSNLDDLLPALGPNVSTMPVKLENGSAVFDGNVTGNLSSPHIVGHVSTAGITYAQESLDSVEADVQASPDYLRVQNAIAVRGPVRAQFQGSVGLSGWRASDASPISATATLANATAGDLLALVRAKDVPLTGTINASAQANGTLGAVSGQADVTAVNGSYQGEPFDRLTAHLNYGNDTLDVPTAQLTAGAKQVKLNATYRHTPARFDQGRLHFQLSTNVMPVEQIQWVARRQPDIKGNVEVTASGDLDLALNAPTPYRIQDLHADLTAKDVHFEGQPVGTVHLTANSQGQVLRAHLDSTIAGSAVRGDGEWRLTGDYPGTATIQFGKVDLANLRRWLSPSSGTANFTGSAEGELRIEGPAQRWQAMRADLRIRQFQIGAVRPAGYTGLAPTITNSGDLVFHFANSTITAESAHFVGPGTDLRLTGRILPSERTPFDMRVDGKLDLAFLHDFLPDFTASGGVSTTATIRGSFSDPQVNGRLEFQKAAFNIADVPNGISNATGVIVFNKDRATIQNFSGETGGGKIELTGFASYGGGRPSVFRLHARASEVRVRYPEGVSTVADANLNLTGTSDNSVLSGTITVLRTGINLQSDVTSILAKSAEPVRTPSARTGLLGGMTFDVQIETSPDIQLQSSMTENVQFEANLKLRGTASNPAVLGRINITQGKLTFFGTQFTLNQGSISFFNPVKIEPILDIDLETKARGIDIILTISGPLNKLTLTPRSDPPLQFSEIVALLATGHTPTSDPSLWNQQTAQQSWSQMGASALLGSAIASPVAGRLQRFFGVSKLRIDPTLNGGVENNPQARLTLEQQVTPEITFTYITNVTNSNPQIIQIEWALTSKWSAVALREENGLFGLDIFYKRRFK